MLNRRNLARLGLEIRRFSPEAFTDYVGMDVGATLYDQAVAGAAPRNLKPEELRVQISLRADLYNAVQFLVTGPHSHQPPSMRSRRAYWCAIYPERNTLPRTGVWEEIGSYFGGDQYHGHLIDIEEAGE